MKQYSILVDVTNQAFKERKLKVFEFICPDCSAAMKLYIDENVTPSLYFIDNEARHKC